MHTLICNWKWEPFHFNLKITYSFYSFQFAANALVNYELADDIDGPLCVEDIFQLFITKQLYNHWKGFCLKMKLSFNIKFNPYLFLDFQAPEVFWLWTHAICPCITKPVYSSSHALPSTDDGRSCTQGLLTCWGSHNVHLQQENNALLLVSQRECSYMVAGCL